MVAEIDREPAGDIDFWGVYATHPLIHQGRQRRYYLGYDRPDARFVQGVADEQRHSLGSRVFGKHGAWDYNVECTFQFGSFGSGDILAWALASDAGYTFQDLTMTPRLGLNAHVIAGEFIKQSGPSADVDYVAIWLQYRF